MNADLPDTHKAIIIAVDMANAVDSLEKLLIKQPELLLNNEFDRLRKLVIHGMEITSMWRPETRGR